MTPNTLYRFRLENRVWLEISLGCFFERLPVNEVRSGDEWTQWLQFGGDKNRSEVINPYEHLETPNVKNYEKYLVLKRYRTIINAVRTDIEQKANRKITSVKMLDCHGCSDLEAFSVCPGYIPKQKRFFLENPSMIDLPDWIEENDGDFDALLVCSCNSSNPAILHSKKSILYYPRRNTDPIQFWRGENYTLFNPAEPGNL